MMVHGNRVGHLDLCIYLSIYLYIYIYICIIDLITDNLIIMMLWLALKTAYPLVIKHSNWKWPFNQSGFSHWKWWIFPQLCNKLPECISIIDHRSYTIVIPRWYCYTIGHRSYIYIYSSSILYYQPSINHYFPWTWYPLTRWYII